MQSTMAARATVAAFVVAGVGNSLGRAATQADYVRWGYPAWWCYATGGLSSRPPGLSPSRPPAQPH